MLLPAEHGSWSLTFEPIALGLLVAPSTAGAFIALAVAAGFLARKPFRLCGGKNAASDLAVRRAALVLTIVFGAVAVVSLGLAVRRVGLIFLSPFLFAAPALALFAWWDRSGQTRTLATEATGIALCASPAVSMSLAAGQSSSLAVALGVIVLSRSLPTLLLVRTCLRRRRDGDVSVFPVHVAHASALLVVIAVCVALHLPWTLAVINALLVVRAQLLLIQREKPWTAKQVGIFESIVGLVHTVAQGMTLLLR